MKKTQDSIAEPQHYKLFPETEEKVINPFHAEQTYNYDTANSLEDRTYPPAQLREENISDWVTLVLLTCFALFAWLRYFHSRRLSQINRALLARHLSNQMIKEGNIYRERISIPLQLMALLSLSYFTYRTFEYFTLIPRLTSLGLNGFAQIFIAITALWFLKLVAVRIAGFLFKTNSSAYIYNLNALVYLSAAGAILLPFNVVSAYLSSGLIIILGLFSIALLFLLWIIRGISVGLDEKGFSVFHLFLYLCTFEILPVLLFLKFIFESS